MPSARKMLTDNFVYQATVKSGTDAQTYIGLASTTFKLRLGNHKKAFNHAQYKTNTSLSSYVWDLKNAGRHYDIEWDMIGRAKPFSPVTNTCNL